jgi:hypothetical protein
MMIAAVLMGCSPVAIRTDFDTAVDFNAYQTYRWMPHPDKQGKNVVPKGSFLDVRVKRAVQREMERKGYVLRERGPVDALLAYHVTVKQRVNVAHYGYGYWFGRTYVNRYKEGTLIIDIVDAEVKQLAWRGTATGAVSSVNESEESINKTVAKILEKYPPF